VPAEERAVTTTVVVFGGDFSEDDVNIVDHPFSYAIRDNESGALLFVGALYDPAPPSH